MSCDVRFSVYLYGIIYILGLLFCAFLIYNKGVFKLEITERLGVLTERSFTMNFLKNISAAFKTAGGAVQGAVKVVEEKNRRTALMNRLRTVIRCEEKAEERAYLALGRYYYHNLRDAENTVTEPYCIDIEAAQKRIDAVIGHVQDGDIVLMHELYNASGDAAVAIIPKLVEQGYQLVTVSELAHIGI